MASVPVINKNAHQRRRPIRSSEDRHEPRFPTARIPLRRNLLFATAGHGVYALSQWGILITLAKLGTPEAVGYFALAISLTAPVVELTGLQLHVAQATDAARHYRLADYLLLRVLTGLAAFSAVLLIVAIGHRPLWFVLTTLVMCSAKIIEGLSLICHGRFQREERLDWVARSQFLRGVVALSGLSLVYWATGSLLTSTVTLALVWTAVYLLHDWPIAAALEKTEKRPPLFSGRKAIGHLSWVSLPLGLAVGLNTLSANMPRYFVDAYFGPKELGIFAALAYVGTGARLFYLPVIHTVMPRLATFAAEGLWGAFRRLLTKAMLAALVVSFVLLGLITLVGEHLIRLIYTAAYADRPSLFVILTAGVLVHFMAAIAIAGLQASRNFLRVTSCYALGNATLFVSLLIGVTYAGLIGAAVATVFGGLGELIPALLWTLRLPREDRVAAMGPESSPVPSSSKVWSTMRSSCADSAQANRNRYS